jgi:MFS family permease
MIVMALVWMGQGAPLVQFAPVIGSLAEEFGVTAGQMSFYGMGLYTLIMALSTILSGILIDKFGAKQFIVGGMAILTICMLVIPVAVNSLTGFVTIRTICALANGPLMSAVTPMGVAFFSPKERITYMGVVSAGFSIGMMLTLLLMGVRLGQTGGVWRASELTIVILPAIALIATIVMVIVTRGISTKVPAVHADKSAGATEWSFAIVLKAPLFWVLLIAFIAVNWCLNSFTDLSPGYIAIDAPTGLGFGEQTSSFLSMVMTIGNIIGAFVVGIIVSKVFKNRVKPVLVIAFAFQAVLIFLTKFEFLTDHRPAFSVVLFLIGFSISWISPCLSTSVMMRFPSDVTAKVWGICFGCGLFAASGGVMIGSTLLHITSSYQMPLLMISLVAVVGFVTVLFIEKAKGVIVTASTIHEAAGNEK